MQRRAFFTAMARYTTAVALAPAEQLAQLAVPLLSPASARAAETPGVLSVLQTGAKGDGTADDTDAIQAAIDRSDRVAVPAAAKYYKITRPLVLRSGTQFVGEGEGSHIHSTSTSRSGGIKAAGTRDKRLSGLLVRDIKLTGLATYANGRPSVSNGAGIDIKLADDSAIFRCRVSGWSDNGIGFTDGQRNSILLNQVDSTAQGVQFFAMDIDCYDNRLIGNVVTNTGTYNGYHVEGHAGKGPGMMYRTIVVCNSSDGSWGLGGNVENAPQSVVVGNVSRNSGRVGASGPTILHGLLLFGSPGSVVSNNVATGNAGYGIVVGARCGNCTVEGNITEGNHLGSCLVTDSGGVAPTRNVVFGPNTWKEGNPAIKGDASFVKRQTGSSR